MDDLRPHSAPPPTRELNVSPLLPICEQLQNDEIRPHSSPPCVTTDDEMQRKPFRNRIHPSASVDINIPRLKDTKPSSRTPKVKDRHSHSAISTSNSVQPKQLFIPSRRSPSSSPSLSHSKFPTDKIPLLEDNATADAHQDVLCHHNAPDILILEDVSDEFSDEESAPQETLQSAGQWTSRPNQRCNTAISSPDEESVSMQVPLQHPVTHTHYGTSNNDNLNKTEQRTSNYPDQSYQKQSSNHIESAMTSFSLSNNLDTPNGKSDLPDKHLNYTFSDQQTARPATLCAENRHLAEMNNKSSMHSKESLTIKKQQFSANKDGHHNDQSLHSMQGEQRHQYKESTVNIRQHGTGQHPSLSSQQHITSITVQECQQKEPYEQIQDMYSSTRRSRPPLVYQYSVAATNGASPRTGHGVNSNGATTGGARPRLHGRSKTSEGVSLLDQRMGGGASVSNPQQLDMVRAIAC